MGAHLPYMSLEPVGG